MKHALNLAICSLFTLCAIAQPATAPTTAPAVETILKGDLQFTPPSGWKPVGKSKDDKQSVYRLDKPQAMMLVNVTPQEKFIDDSAAPRIGATVLKQIREKDQSSDGKFKLITQPKIEPDDRFFLRVSHRFVTDVKEADQLQIYRVMGLNLVAVSTFVYTDSPNEVKEVFEQAEKTLLGVRSIKEVAQNTPRTRAMKPATRPTVLPAAKISFRAPADWRADTSENASGIVASYKHPSDPFNMIAISVSPLPKEARTDAKLRDTAVEGIVAGEKAQFKFDGAEVVGETENVTDRRFLKKVRIRYEKSDAKIQVTSRQLRIGDAVVSVAMASMEASAAEVDKLADEVALTLKAAGR